MYIHTTPYIYIYIYNMNVQVENVNAKNVRCLKE